MLHTSKNFLIWKLTNKKCHKKYISIRRAKGGRGGKKREGREERAGRERESGRNDGSRIESPETPAICHNWKWLPLPLPLPLPPPPSPTPSPTLVVAPLPYCRPVADWGWNWRAAREAAMFFMAAPCLVGCRCCNPPSLAHTHTHTPCLCVCLPLWQLCASSNWSHFCFAYASPALPGRAQFD